MVLKCQYHLLIKIKSMIKKENLILINIIKRRVTKNIKVIIDTKDKIIRIKRKKLNVLSVAK